MNRNILILIAVLVALVGVGIYVRFGGPNVNTVKITNHAKTSESKNEYLRGTIKSILTMKEREPQACDYSVENNIGSAKGKLYAANGKMRIDFISPNASAAISGHIIVDSGYSYLWLDSKEQGIKILMNLIQPSTTPAAEEKSNILTQGLDQAVYYRCEKWTENAAIFNVPSDIKFTEMELPTSMSSGVSSKLNNQSACKACDELPEGEAKSTCKTQLNCN